jgi:hypothetical protein
MKTHAATSKSPARATCAVLQAKPAREGARALTPPDYGIDFVDRRLRAGLEAASGMDFSDVRVHRNSPLPAQINALAYTRGNDIHLGPGQERHLAHEAWHVVQQRQGRVQATMQAKGVGINDDSALEREADVMGARAAMDGAQAGQPAVSPVAYAGRESAVVQRLVGFEIEVPSWVSARRTVHETNTLNARHKQTLPAAAANDVHPRDHLVTGNLVPNAGVGAIPYRFESLVKKDVIVDGTASNNGFRLEADESNQGGLTNMEFVTIPFQDTGAGGLALSRTLTKITKMADKMSSLAADTAAGYYIPASKLASFGAPSPNVILFPNTSWAGVMQVTAAVDLARVETLMTQMGGVRPLEAAPTTANLMEGRYVMGGALNSVANANPTGNGPVVAAQAIAGYDAAHGATAAVAALYFARTGAFGPAPPFGSAKLAGLVSLIYQYIVTANQALGGYAKTIAPLMARTDFAQLFADLPVDERTYLQQNNAERFISVVMRAVHATHPAVSRHNDLFQHGLYHNHALIPGINVNALAGLTRRAWLRGIAQGTDYLTAAHFNANPALGLPLPHPVKSDLESLGSFGANMEPAGAAGSNAPIFEIRSIGQIASYKDWYSRAMDLFQYLRELNDGTGAFYRDTMSNLPAGVQADLRGGGGISRSWARRQLRANLERRLRP